MRLYRLESTDPYYNLAVEEHILRCWKEDVLLLWRNKNTIVVGRNQNTAEEINQSYADANNINIVRRISGGGAVYHDLNNVNFSFIVGLNTIAEQRMADFMTPIAAALNNMGVPAMIDGRNDLAVHGKRYPAMHSPYIKSVSFTTERCFLMSIWTRCPGRFA